MTNLLGVEFGAVWQVTLVSLTDDGRQGCAATKQRGIYPVGGNAHLHHADHALERICACRGLIQILRVGTVILHEAEL